MKTFCFYTLLIFIYGSLMSCHEKEETLDNLSALEASDMIDRGCLSSFEINSGGTGDTINKIYGKDFKVGHWIDFELITTNLKTNIDTGKTGDMRLKRIKREEGYYINNKKEGFWKLYNFDGSIKDSVEFKNNRRLIK